MIMGENVVFVVRYIKHIVRQQHGVVMHQITGTHVRIVDVQENIVQQHIQHQLHGAVMQQITGNHVQYVHIKQIRQHIVEAHMQMEENVQHVARYIKRIVRQQHGVVMHQITGTHVRIVDVQENIILQHIVEQRMIMEENVQHVAKYMKLIV